MVKQYIEMGINFSELVRNTLGPFGLNNIVANDHTALSTNDGATLIKNLDANDPIAVMFKNLAKSQEKNVGDGTTTAMILAGELLRNALTLINQNMHKIHIIKGYDYARMLCLKFLEENKIESDKEKIMKTTFGSKIPQSLSEQLVKLLLNQEMERLKVYQREGDQRETKMIRGYAFKGYTINDRMPKEREGKIAVMDLNTNLENTKMAVQSSEELVKVNRQFRKFKKDIVDKLIENEVGVFIYTDTNPQIESLLTEKGIMGVVQYRRDEIDNICRACGAKAISDPESDYSNSLGRGKVNYDKENQTIEIISEKSDLDTLVLCGQTKEILEETSRAIEDVIGVLKKIDMCVIGAGAIEIELANYLRNEATKISGKLRLPIECFADSLETIPLILAQNAGLDALDVLTKLKTAHESDKNIGIDEEGISDAFQRGIIEPVLVKAHAINSSTDVANLIIKLDKVLKGEDAKPSKTA